MADVDLELARMANPDRDGDPGWIMFPGSFAQYVALQLTDSDSEAEETQQ